MALQPHQRRMRTCGLLPRRPIDRSQALWPEKNASGGIFHELRSLCHRCCDLPKIRYYGSWCPWLRVHLFLLILWIQFGPNSTTFLVAGEVYPAPVRATAHGLSAAVGKCGALTATVLYNYIGSRTKFWVVCWFGLIGFCLTVMFIPDTTGLDLREQERYWQFVREGR